MEVRGPERNATRYHLRGSLAREREYTYARICGCQWLCSWALFPLIAPAWWTRSNRTGRGEGPLATPRSHARVPCKFRGVSKRATGDERRDGLKIFGLRENVGPPRDSFHPIDFIKRLMDLVRIEGSSDLSSAHLARKLNVPRVPHLEWHDKVRGGRALRLPRESNGGRG